MTIGVVHCFHHLLAQERKSHWLRVSPPVKKVETTLSKSLEDPSVDAEKAELRLLFKAIDVDSSGHISKEEFQEALHTSKKVQKFVNESQVLRVLVAREDFDTAFMKMDTDRRTPGVRVPKGAA